MTAEERKATLNKMEKYFYTSKKWIAWFIQQALMTTMAIIALIKQPELGWPLAAFMSGIVFMMGVSTMWLIGKQAAADIAIRGFALTGQVTKSLSDQLLDIDSKAKKEEPA